ncbi:MAG: GNAT family N-acetyltransferase [Candidatus Micrarchaeota archaeon]|nr:GNAT family N-acetyltransferase [Candidatus Micrarchaeota archaeon]
MEAPKGVDRSAKKQSDSSDMLKFYRKQMDEITEDSLKLYKKRLDIAVEIGKIKGNAGAGVLDVKREQEVMEKVEQICMKIGLNPDLGKAFVNRLIKDSREVQDGYKIRTRLSQSGAYGDKYSIGSFEIGEIPPKLVLKLMDIGKNTFGRGMENKELFDHITESDLVVIPFTAEGNPVGFGSLKIVKRDGMPKTMFLSAAVIDDSDQNKGLYKELVRKRLEFGIEDGCTMVRTHTQNPIVEAGITRVLEGLAGEGIIAEFVPIVEHVNQMEYGRLLTKNIPSSSNEELNKRYEEQLDYFRGDSYSLAFSIVPLRK